jgi:large-conductance mechanosensitive channel
MDKFQKTTWPWQIEQIQQRIGEWIEAKVKFAAPKQGLPAWLISFITNLLWFLLIAGAVWIAYLILSRYQQQFRHRHPPDETAVQPSKTYTVAELLAQAQQWQNQKNYGEACDPATIE